ncbi:MAG: hypothetical protein ACI9J2_000741 [Saprospiraceae bacterium]|jgi:hypothetical protein
MRNYHLSQINIALAHDSMESETMSSFVERLDEINALADQSPGFIWRLQTDEGDATAIVAFEDPLIIVNMSVWKNMEVLQNYVYKSIHVDLLRNKRAWFSKMKNAHQVLWWVPEGHTPSVEEGKERLTLLNTNGPNKEAFTFAQSYSEPQ